MDDVIVGWYPRNPETGRALTSQARCGAHFVRAAGAVPSEANAQPITDREAMAKDLACVDCLADLDATGGDPVLARFVLDRPLWDGSTPLVAMPADPVVETRGGDA